MDQLPNSLHFSLTKRCQFIMSSNPICVHRGLSMYHRWLEIWVIETNIAVRKTSPAPSSLWQASPWGLDLMNSPYHGSDLINSPSLVAQTALWNLLRMINYRLSYVILIKLVCLRMENWRRWFSFYFLKFYGAQTCCFVYLFALITVPDAQFAPPLYPCPYPTSPDAQSLGSKSF